MGEEQSPRRPFSLRSALATDPTKDGADDAQNKLVERAGTRRIVRFHITEDDVSKGTSRATPRTPQEATRDTRAIVTQSRKPGTYSFDEPPTLLKTNWELERSKRSRRTPAISSRRPLKAGKVQQQLPREIVLRILDHLKSLHFSRRTLNITSYQNDLRTLCSVNRYWHWLAREFMYREVWLPGNGERKKGNLPFRKTASRLKLFLRTINESPTIPDSVRILRLTARLADELESETWSASQTSKDSVLRVLRDIIIKCQNLEELSGYAPVALDSNAELFDALSSRNELKSHTWRLPPADYRSRSIDILKCHNTVPWQKLETLILSQSTDGYSIGQGLVSAIIQRLPSLKHLMLQRLSRIDFHNGTLLSFPPLKSLRLEEVHGVTDKGIEQLVQSRLAMSLERLTLIGLELTSLHSLQRLFTNLLQLHSFTLVQDTSPEIPNVFSATHNNFYLASATICYLHWNVLANGNSIVILANSIAAGKLPELKVVKVPCDDDGVVQNLCRPIALQPISGRDMTVLEEWERSSNFRRSLRVSQIQAQIRLRKQRRLPSSKIVIQNEPESTQHTHLIGSYLGNVASTVEYSLEPAVEDSEFAIVRLEDVLISGKGQSSNVSGKGEEYVLDVGALF